MSQRLYLVVWINQSTGTEVTSYVLARSAEVVEDEFVDIVKIEPLTPLLDLGAESIKGESK